MSTTIDYKGVLTYLDTHPVTPYKKQDACDSDEEKQKYLTMAEDGRAVINIMKQIAERAKELYGLDWVEPGKWLDGSNTKTRNYLWTQLKYSSKKAAYSSISIFAEKDGEKPAFYRVSLEIKKDSATKEELNLYHTHLDIPCDKSAGLVYAYERNEWGHPSVLDESQDEIKDKVESGEYDHVQVCKYIETTSGKTNDDYDGEIMEAIKAIKPFYDYVVEKTIPATTVSTPGSSTTKGEAEVKSKFDKNMILYGPPGTGKTYHTAIYAVAICDSEQYSLKDVKSWDYSKVMERFKELQQTGQVAFTTFHQSYGYEEFIEGIRPVVDDATSSDLRYERKDGIFYAFCKDAHKEKVETSSFTVGEDAVVWKVTVRTNVKQDCFDNNRVRIDWAFDSEGAAGFVNDMKAGDIILTTDGSRSKINGIAVVESDQAYSLSEKADTTTRDVKWIAKDINEDVTNINKGKLLHRMTCSRVPNVDIGSVVTLAKSKNSDLTDTNVVKNTKPYVFIIDEINRGNISKIFGELITLIEDTKREGMPEAASAILPYSGQPFSVPENVYILGTMNTADRSIALMDTALRRRFQFVEMLPDAQVLRNIGASKVGDIEIDKMLETINERITFLYDREHTIGHAFFTKLKEKENQTMDVLKAIFEKSVIPLLQEYFYEDYQKIQFVLGDNAKKDSNLKFILDIDVSAKNIFKGSIDDFDLAPKDYKVNNGPFDDPEKDDPFLNPESYKQIYQ